MFRGRDCQDRRNKIEKWAATLPLIFTDDADRKKAKAFTAQAAEKSRAGSAAIRVDPR
jgi:lipopolysaccharide biosynthesis protein